MHRLIAIGAAVAVTGCLPGDNRPEPGKVLVSAEPSEATKGGFSTADGWSVRFDRFVTALGDVELDGPGGRDDDSCNAYSESHYEWLYDFTVLERGKVGVVYGLGECSVGWRSRGPSDDTVLGAGATESDVRYMITEASDSYAEEQRVTLLATGVAEKGEARKSFSWSFRRSYEIDNCASASSEGLASVYMIRGGDQITVPIVVRGEELFRSAPSDDAPLAFEPFAAADANQDGSIELAELETVTVDVEVASPPEGQEQPETLADLVYTYSLPRITRMAGSGPCEYELRERRR